MSICHGCGGVIGRDCFNPIECEQITRSMAFEYQNQQEQPRNGVIPNTNTMKKLFLTSFVFTTGGIEYKTDRLVVVKSTDLVSIKDPLDDPWLEAGYDKAIAWFPTEFPESKLQSCMVFPAIENRNKSIAEGRASRGHEEAVLTKEEIPNPLLNPCAHHLTVVFKWLKFGRPAESQKYLDKCIAELEDVQNIDL